MVKGVDRDAVRDSMQHRSPGLLRIAFALHVLTLVYLLHKELDHLLIEKLGCQGETQEPELVLTRHPSCTKRQFDIFL